MRRALVALALLLGGILPAAAQVSDLSVASSLPVSGVPANKLIYGIQEFPTNVNNRTPDSGAAWVTKNNSAYGYLVTGGVAPVMVQNMGASLDNSNGALADDQAWSTAMAAYLNGTAAGGPTFSGCQQTMSMVWQGWGNLAGQNPDGTNNADGTLRAGQQAVWSTMLYTPTCAAAARTAWNPADKSVSIALSNNNETATSTQTFTFGSGSASVRSTTTKSTGKWCFEENPNAWNTNWNVGIANSSFPLGQVIGLGTDANGIGTESDQIYYNGAQLSAGSTTLSTGQPQTICADLDAHLWWSTNAPMRGAGFTWNNSPTANPATGTGGLSFSGLVCPCFAIFNDNTAGGIATLNTPGPFAVATPGGFLPWDNVLSVGHPILINLGANDNQRQRKAS